MPMTKTEVKKSILALPREEQLEIADEIYQPTAEMPLTDWQRDVLQERIAEAKVNPEDGKPWAEVKAELQASLKAR